MKEIPKEEIKDNLETFESCQKIFRRKYPKAKPKYKIYPNAVNLKLLNKEKLNFKGAKID